MAGRDFTADRQKVVVLDSQAVRAAKTKLSETEQESIEERVMDKLKIPRR